MVGVSGLIEYGWRLYQASPPLLLAILIVASSLGFHRLNGRIDTVLGRVEEVEETQQEHSEQIARHEILVDDATTKAEDAQDRLKEMVDEETLEELEDRMDTLENCQERNERRIHQIRADRRAEGKTNNHVEGQNNG